LSPVKEAYRHQQNTAGAAMDFLTPGLILAPVLFKVMVTLMFKEGHMRSIIVSVAVAAILIFGVCQVCQAQVPPNGNPCAPDIAKLCKEIKPGQGNIAKCLKDHDKDLSPACKTFIGGMHKGMNDFREGCKTDVAKFCKDIKPGDKRLVQCLKEHQTELSTSCKPFFSKM